MLRGGGGGRMDPVFVCLQIWVGVGGGGRGGAPRGLHVLSRVKIITLSRVFLVLFVACGRRGR